MTQKDSNSKEMELVKNFLALDERGQESALIILKSLEFAQSVMCGTEKGFSEKREVAK